MTSNNWFQYSHQRLFSGNNFVTNHVVGFILTCSRPNETMSSITFTDVQYNQKNEGKNRKKGFATKCLQKESSFLKVLIFIDFINHYQENVHLWSICWPGGTLSSSFKYFPTYSALNIFLHIML